MDSNMDTVKDKAGSSFYTFVLGYDGENSDDDIMISDSDSSASSECDSDDCPEPLVEDHAATKTLTEKEDPAVLNSTNELSVSNSSCKTPTFPDWQPPRCRLSISTSGGQNQTLPTPEQKDSSVNMSTWVARNSPMDTARISPFKDLTSDQSGSSIPKQNVQKIPQITKSIAPSCTDVCSTIEAISLTSKNLDSGTVSTFERPVINHSAGAITDDITGTPHHLLTTATNSPLSLSSQVETQFKNHPSLSPVNETISRQFISNASTLNNPISRADSERKTDKFNGLDYNEQKGLQTFSEQWNSDPRCDINTDQNTSNSNGPPCESSMDATNSVCAGSKPVYPSESESNHSSSRNMTKSVDNITDGKKPCVDMKKFHRSCKIISTENGDTVDFSKFIWPSHYQHCADACVEIDDRLQTRIRMRRGIISFSKPAIITFESSHLHKMHVHGHTKDPRVMKSTASFSQQRIDKGCDTKNTNNRERNSPEKGLFSKFMPLSDHTSSNAFSSTNICDTSQSQVSQIAQKDGAIPTEKQNNPLCSLYKNLFLRNHFSSPVSSNSTLLAQSQKPSTYNTNNNNDNNNNSNHNNKIISGHRACNGEKPSDNSQGDLLENHKALHCSSRSTVINSKAESKFEKIIQEINSHKQSRMKCEGLQKRSLPVPVPKCQDAAGSNKKIKRHKFGKKPDRSVDTFKHSTHQDGFQIEKVLPDQDRSRVKHNVQRHCRKAKRSVLDYHLCSQCMLDQTVMYLKPPTEKTKSSSCLKCRKRLNPRDQRCKYCKQCFPNILTYAGHYYNLAIFHPPLKDVNDFVCTTCRRLFPTRFQFHTHISQSRCARICLPCERIFVSRKAKQEHECGAEKIP